MKDPHNPKCQKVNLRGEGDSFLGGRLFYFANRWREFEGLVRLMKRGITWKWKIQPPTFKLKFQKQTRSLDMYVRELLERQIIIETNYIRFQGKLFQVPKKDSSEYRTILDLSELNKYIQCHSFKMTTITALRNVLPENIYVGSIDLKDAYWHIPVMPHFQKFLGFRYNNKKYMFRCLPFGLNVAPRIFTHICKPIIRALSKEGHNIINYLDDWLVWSKSEEGCRISLHKIVDRLIRLGFVINLTKSSLIPSQQITYLGIIWNFKNFSCKVNKRFRLELKRSLRVTLRAKWISCRKIESLIGKLNFISPLLKVLNPLNKSLIGLFRHLACPKRRDLQVPIGRKQRKVIRNILQVDFNKRVRIGDFKSEIQIHTDASLEGWGVVAGDKSLNGTWSSVFKNFHINTLELVAVVIAVKRLKIKRSTRIQLFCDNKTVVGVINKGGSARSKPLNKWALTLFSLLQRRGLSIAAFHIKGSRNVLADLLSRNRPLSTEWELDIDSFQCICRRVGLTPEIDLFATHLNHKLKKFVTPYSHPEAVGSNALALDWNRWESVYMFPPTPLIPLIIQKLKTFKGKAILVTPHWEALHWWAPLRQILIMSLVIETHTLSQKIRDKIFWNKSRAWSRLSVWTSWETY